MWFLYVRSSVRVVSVSGGRREAIVTFLHSENFFLLLIDGLGEDCVCMAGSKTYHGGNWKST